MGHAWPGWQRRASRIRNVVIKLFFRDRVLLPSLPPSHHVMLRSQAGPHAGARPPSIPSDAHTALTLLWPPKPCRSRFAAGCGCRCRWLRDCAGNHPITDVGNALATSATIRLRVPGLGCSLGALKSWNGLGAESREAVGPEGHVLPQQWLANAPAPGVAADDRRRLDLWSSMERHRWAICFNARRCPEIACPTEEQLHGMGRPECGRTAQAGHVPGARPRRRPNPWKTIVQVEKKGRRRSRAPVRR